MKLKRKLLIFSTSIVLSLTPFVSVASCSKKPAAVPLDVLLNRLINSIGSPTNLNIKTSMELDIITREGNFDESVIELMGITGLDVSGAKNNFVFVYFISKLANVHGENHKYNVEVKSKFFDTFSTDKVAFTLVSTNIFVNEPDVPGRAPVVEGLTIVGDVENIPEEDDYWDIVGLSYDESTHPNIENKKYYTDLSLNEHGNYNPLPLTEWYKTFDVNLPSYQISQTEAKSLLNIPDSAPKDYAATNKQFIKIYGESPDGTSTIETPIPSATRNSVTGFNNNPFRTFYTGAYFDVGTTNVSADRKFKKDQTDNTYIEGSGEPTNGWEHVTCQSHIQSTLGNGTALEKYAVADLFNLKPSMQNQMNSPRSNNMFGLTNSINYRNGQHAVLGASTNAPSVPGNIWEPRPEIRGDIARTVFYMKDRYHVAYSIDFYILMTLWAVQDPVTKEELEWNRSVKTIMGVDNEYITGKKSLPFIHGITNDLSNQTNNNDFIFEPTINLNRWKQGLFIHPEDDASVNKGALQWV